MRHRPRHRRPAAAESRSGMPVLRLVGRDTRRASTASTRPRFREPARRSRAWSEAEWIAEVAEDDGVPAAVVGARDASGARATPGSSPPRSTGSCRSASMPCRRRRGSRRPRCHRGSTAPMRADGRHPGLARRQRRQPAVTASTASSASSIADGVAPLACARRRRSAADHRDRSVRPEQGTTCQVRQMSVRRCGAIARSLGVRPNSTTIAAARAVRIPTAGGRQERDPAEGSARLRCEAFFRRRSGQHHRSAPTSSPPDHDGKPPRMQGGRDLSWTTPGNRAGYVRPTRMLAPGTGEQNMARSSPRDSRGDCANPDRRCGTQWPNVEGSIPPRQSRQHGCRPLGRGPGPAVATPSRARRKRPPTVARRCARLRPERAQRWTVSAGGSVERVRLGLDRHPGRPGRRPRR